MRSEPGAPVEGDFIPLCIPEIGGREWEYVKDCLDSGWVSSVGAYVDRFERMVAERAGASHAVATVNGTAALHTALLVAGVRPDDEVLVSTLSFIAPANAIRYVGAWPVFIDAEPVFWQWDHARAEAFLETECEYVDHCLRNKSTGRRVKALLPVHILGHPVRMEPLLELARRFNLAVIEDATESLGARSDGRPVGVLGDIGCFSFNGNKLLTTGGGGMLVTNHPEWAKHAKYLTTQAKDDPVEYIHREIGFNHRLTNLQAAMGCAQLEKLDEYIAIKRRIAARYQEELSGLPWIATMTEADWAFSVFWMFTVSIDPAAFPAGSRGLLKRLHERKIQTRPLWQPLHLSPAHPHAPVAGGKTAEALYESALSLPCSVGLTEQQQTRVIDALRDLAP